MIDNGHEQYRGQTRPPPSRTPIVLPRFRVADQPAASQPGTAPAPSSHTTANTPQSKRGSLAEHDCDIWTAQGRRGISAAILETRWESSMHLVRTRFLLQKD
ncbi:MAG: hypothetical protein Q9219_005659 [cf. Caloplaca sp. 3 TL-2023]